MKVISVRQGICVMISTPDSQGEQGHLSKGRFFLGIEQWEKIPSL